MIVPGVSDAWLALGGALLGGSGLKVVEHFLQRSKIRDDMATAFRNELRQEVTALKEELRKVEEDLDKWRGKYYDLMDNFIKVKGELDAALRTIKEQSEEAAEKLQALDNAVQTDNLS